MHIPAGLCLGTRFLRGERGVRGAASQPPDEATGDHERNGNQLRAGHDASEDFAAAGIIAQKLDEEALHTVEHHKDRENLSIEFLAFQEPHEQDEVEKLRAGFNQLRGFDPHTQRCATDGIGQGIGEGDAPKMVGRLAIAATGGEASEAPEDVAEGEARSKGVHRAQDRHTVTARVPRAHQESGQQAPGENASGLQRVEAEDLTPVAGVGAPIVDDVENLRADNAREDHEDAEVPGVVAVDALFFRIADADPKAEQNTGCNQHAVSRQIKTANVEESRKHFILDAPMQAKCHRRV